MKTLLRQWLARHGWIVVSSRHPAAAYLARPPRTAFESTLLLLFPRLDHLTFIQVGANDGRRADPIHHFITHHGWRGVMIEPLPSLFRQLRETYAGQPGLVLLAAAVDRQGGHRELFHLRENLAQTVPDWAWGLGSFDRTRVLQAAAELGLPESAIAADSVPTITWDEVWRQLPDGRCDILVIDTEGYDVTLLEAADLRLRRPRLIQFEHACVSPDRRLDCYRMLLESGYELASDGPDTSAWLRP